MLLVNQKAQPTSINQSSRIARILGCRRGCRCIRCLSRKYVFSLFNMIFHTSSLFAQLQKTKPNKTPKTGVSVHPTSEAEVHTGSKRPRRHSVVSLLQHRQWWHSGWRWRAPLRPVRSVWVQKFILFFVRCGNQGAGVFTGCITVPRL